MYSQRAGVAGSPEIHLILTSSLSVHAERLQVGGTRCFTAPVIKRGSLGTP